MTISEMEKNGVKMQRIYLGLSFPLVLSQIVSLIYNLVDTYFVAATGNTNLIAGVSLCSPLFIILMAVGNIYGQGGSSPISRSIGEKDFKSVREVSALCFYQSVFLGMVIAILMLLLQRPFLWVLGSGSETFVYAAQYYRWISVGAPVIILNFVTTNLLRSEGMSKEAMVGSISGGVLNIILDPLFIKVLGLGAAGAAIASDLGFVLTDVYCLAIIWKKSRLLSLNPKNMKSGIKFTGQIYAIGVPAALTNVMHSVGMILMNQFLLVYGNDKIAAMGIALKVYQIVNAALLGFSFGGLPLFGYYYGAGAKEKFMKLIRFSMAFICCISIIMSAIVFGAARSLVCIFVDDSSLISAGTLMLRCLVCTTVAAGIVLLINLLYQAMGKAKEMFVLSISRQGVVYIVILFLASRLAGYYGILISQAISDVLSAGIAITMFLFWRKSYLGEKQLIRKHKSCSSPT